MAEYLQQIPLFPLVLTIGAFLLGQWLQNKWKTPLLNPVLISVTVVIAVLVATGFPVEDYQEAAKGISWLLTPATICMALPLYEQFRVLKKSLPAIIGGVAAGTVSSLAVIFGLCKLFALDRSLTVGLLPKSVTTALGIVLAGENGGLVALTTAAILVTGLLGSFLGSTLCKILKLKDPISQGVALGTASHVIGTSRANELGSLQGAVSGLSLVVAALLTAILFPFVCMLL